MLDKNEYENLLNFFNVQNTAIFTQINHYFDTPDFLLKEKGAALRIREKAGEFEMTLKQPFQEGLLETNQILSAGTAELAFRQSQLPAGEIQERLEKMDIPFANLEYFGSLVTKRAEVKDSNGLFVLDYSSYLNTEDYELEYEVENFQRGQEVFNEFLEKHGIPKRKTKNKVHRFYQRKYSIMDS